MCLMLLAFRLAIINASLAAIIFLLICSVPFIAVGVPADALPVFAVIAG